MPKLTFGAEVHRLVPKLFRAEVTRAEHRLPLLHGAEVKIRSRFGTLEVHIYDRSYFSAEHQWAG